MPSILVVGSVNSDLILPVEHMPQPGETVPGKGCRNANGGKGANQAVAAARLGGAVTFVGRIGNDENGRRMKIDFEKDGIDTGFLTTDQELPTGLAVILLEDNGQNRIIINPGATLHLHQEDILQAFENRRYDGVLFQMEMTDEAVFAVYEAAHKAGIPLFLDAGPAKPFPIERLTGLTVISPNETEAEALTGISITSPEDARRAAAVLFDRCHPQFVVMKLGSRGSLLYDGKHFTSIAPVPVVSVDSTAAGDCFTAALVCRYLSRGDMTDACRYASVAGAFAVTRPGAQPSLPRKEELEAFIKERH